MIYQCKDCQTEVEFDVGIYCDDCRLTFHYKPTDTHEERLANFKPWTEEEIRMWNVKYKNWYWFAGVIPGTNYKKTWIEQYRIVDPEYNGKVKQGRPRKNKGDI